MSAVEVLVPLGPLAAVLEDVLRGQQQPSGNNGPRSISTLGGAGAVALTLLALLMLVSSSMAATTAIAPTSRFALPWRRAEGAPKGAGTSWYKGWSGRRAPQGPGGDRTIVTMVYYHEQTIAVVELGKGKTLRNCELIEVYEPVEISDALRNLSSVGKSLEISFTDMMTLMAQCHELQMPVPEQLPPAASSVQQQQQQNSTRGSRGAQKSRGLLGNAVANPFAILNGIVPGTKWCGTGDIAATYYDLGPETSLDRCCRTHDLCPVKVRSYQFRYNLTNDAIFSKSHCDCDDALFRCLKNTQSATADVIGNIYFNIVQVPCLEHLDVPQPPNGKQGDEPMRFAKQHFAY